MKQNPTVLILNNYATGVPEDKEYVIFGSINRTKWVLNLMQYRGGFLGTAIFNNPGRSTMVKVKQWLTVLGVTPTVQNTITHIITDGLNELEAVFESSENPIKK
ncbi:MAG: hypothetical protein UU77_C0041G0007 [candidate division WWE3 bacterium GW2011_GWC1_41_7]|uniref:Uncharacterized protein n=1 Tax=candidate division WWE3 bacterium GW2011_GWC1_41_7 TaxID=1619119 RepID=A0A0G1A2Y4_UNCKA|nr:MAG: hypothetical protein UU77_C0041G0007 [candidate division WWE3 bacterium GW2011_GWC1_41_7]